jgi:glutathione S-transferase
VTTVIHQVPVAQEERAELLARTGVRTIPVLVDETGAVHVGETDILEHLDSLYPESEGAEAHRLKAIRAREREREEASRWLEPATH